MKQAGIKKLYYSISEVSKITGLEQYVLRYWETEFDQLKPSKNRAGNRIYTNRDIKTILYIKKLLREERYTIEGAKQVLQAFIPDGEGEQLDLLGEVAPVPSQAPPGLTAADFMPSGPTAPSAPSAAAMRGDDPRIQKDLVEVKKFLEEMLIRLT